MTIETLRVELGERSYDIRVGSAIIGTIGAVCRDAVAGRRVAVVTNTTVGPLYAGGVADSLTAAGFNVLRIEIPDGEEHKTSATLNRVYDRLVNGGLTRDSLVVALGGGVVGDLAGYAAATYLRGIPFVQVPTTLLAQVDSSVGGKTGINHPLGKNLIGAFHQPRAVLIDVDTLATLPRREYLGGLAEVIKYGVVLDGEFFAFLEQNVSALLGRDRQTLVRAITRCCALKAWVVEQDEREAGLRAVLNYGHTFGHAVEALTGYTAVLHGEAVAIGMVRAAVLAEARGYSSAGDTRRIRALVEAVGLPTGLPSFDADSYRDVLLRDKKARDRGLDFVLNRGIGSHEIVRIENLSEVFGICGVGE
ncbi:MULTISPECIES: 3-dehydroquinate synthase [Geobacter]|uniref:3-dehydroquinate synthase n=2 Tax=Geobacter TaxID=28231 RepID=A0A0C1TRQ4_9BACT|nr:MULTISPECIES: 3-dehydroquinate synthase [Geobacter]KIE41943.1 3-dehydroquinate synthase [Geobacter soli]MBE2886809.1 3-dehydroquinate synthase [Geobacter anodireducens]HMN04065.1 3-dehydroquinate synthase [Geobacter anodireducens]